MKSTQDPGSAVDGALLGELDIRLGKLEFSGKGQQAWLETQLKTLVAAIPTMERVGTDVEAPGPSAAAAAPGAKVALASHIKAKSAEKNQALRFLVTADWLRLRGAALTAKAVAKALTENHQSRLANPADCLNKNVAKGYCEKADGGFYITPEGMNALGYS